MAGELDKLFKDVAKRVQKELGESFSTEITYTRKASPSYDVTTGAVTTTDTTYTFDAPIEIIVSDEEAGYQENTARLMVTPDQIGDNQATLQDEISLPFAGSSRTAKIQDIRTFRGEQEYLYMIRVVF
ncbi:hypothetical protein [Limnobacter sp.]|uniref:hypothetical protein n=1 Tax=Limnobacter sp. TaxID=2003368 RepID=UPI0025B9FD07|nr:hypothetical protein [Limnobacter sp.]